MKAVLLFILALSWAGLAQAGEMIKRPLGVDDQGQVIEGYVFQADSSCDRRSNRNLGYSLGYGYPYTYGSSIYLPRGSASYQSLPVVRVHRGQRPVLVVPQRAPVVKPVTVVPARATIIIR